MADPRIIAVDIDADTPVADERECTVAVADLLAANHASCSEQGGPYRLRLALAGPRLSVALAMAEAVPPCATAILPLARLRRPMADYLAICRSHRDAAAGGGAERIETIDMARRALHNDAASALQESLAPAMMIDFETARRLFTLLCALQLKG